MRRFSLAFHRTGRPSSRRYTDAAGLGSTALGVVGLSLAALALTGAAPVGSGTDDALAVTGQVLLYENPDFTGRTKLVGYSTCNGLVHQVAGQVASFDNRPFPGCTVTLTSRTGASFRLCAGRGTIPTLFRQPSRLLVQPGNSVPCDGHLAV
jgi:hypothetical protein